MVTPDFELCAEFETMEAALAKVAEINNAGLWDDGITRHYCTEAEIKEENGCFYIPVFSGYQTFFEGLPIE